MTGGGSSAALASSEQCNDTDGIAMPAALCAEGCCKTAGTYMTAPHVFCLEDGTILDNSKCEQTCCIDALGYTWGDLMLKGECDDKFWSYYDDDFSYCDKVCCMVPDGPKFWVKYLCNGQETSWDNCPGKCGKAEDCGAPHCKEGVDNVAVDWTCDADGNCQTEEETCEGEGGFCAAGICFE